MTRQRRVFLLRWNPSISSFKKDESNDIYFDSYNEQKYVLVIY